MDSLSFRVSKKNFFNVDPSTIVCTKDGDTKKATISYDGTERGCGGVFAPTKCEGDEVICEGLH